MKYELRIVVFCYENRPKFRGKVLIFLSLVMLFAFL